MQKQNQKHIPLCIPRMEIGFPREKIFKIFVKLNIGFIEYIHEIPLKNNNNYKRVIIKIKWNTSETSKYIKQRISENLPVNLIYDFPFFWHIMAAQYNPKYTEYTNPIS